MGGGFLLMAALAAAAPGRTRAADLAKTLRVAMRGKVLILREFHSGKRLEYDDQGRCLKCGAVGPWTVDGEVKVSKIQVDLDGLEIKGERMGLIYSQASKDFESTMLGPVQVRIQAQAPVQDLGAAYALVTRVFLSSQENLSNFVPPYWQAFLSGNIPKAIDLKRHLEITPPRKIKGREPPYARRRGPPSFRARWSYPSS